MFAGGVAVARKLSYLLFRQHNKENTMAKNFRTLQSELDSRPGAAERQANAETEMFAQLFGHSQQGDCYAIEAPCELKHQAPQVLRNPRVFT